MAAGTSGVLHCLVLIDILLHQLDASDGGQAATIQ